MLKGVLFFVLAVVSFEILAADQTLSGRVVKVKDGDSFVMRSEGLVYEIRMYGIDAPEYEQPYGKKSAQALRSLIDSKNINVIKTGSDTYGRLIGKVYIGKTYINLEMVKSGNAHWYSKYAPQDKDLQSAEQAAKQSKLGLWAQPNPILPSQWRKQAK